MAEKTTLRQVAERAGVAIGTASAVFAEKDWVSDRVRSAVREAADELGYRPRTRRPVEPAAVSSIGFLSWNSGTFSTTDNAYFGPVLHGAQKVCADLGITLQYEVVDPSEGRLPLCVERGQVAGLLVLSYASDDEYLRRIIERGVPCVLLEHGPVQSVVDHVRHDDELGGYLAARHLLSLGREPRMPGALMAAYDLTPSIDRLAGLRRALAEAGVPFDEDYVRRGYFNATSGLRGMLELLELDNPPTTVFCGNDETAFGAMEAVRAKGLRIPEDIAITGYDDSPRAALAEPPLTTVATDKELIGEQAVRHLMERLRNPDMTGRDTRLSVRLVERASTLGAQ